MPEVSHEAAYRAAMTRTHKLTDALVLADARVMELEREVGELTRAERAAFQRYESARDRGTRWRRKYEQAVGDDVAKDKDVQEAEEVGGNGASTCDYAEAVGEVVRPENVSG